MVARKKQPKARRRKWYFSEKELAVLAADDPVRSFAEIVAGRPGEHCRWVHLAVRRHARDVVLSQKTGDRRQGTGDRGAFPFIYDVRRASRPAAFAIAFRGTEGPLAGQTLDFLPWQRFCAAQLFGWRRREDPRKRRFAYALIKVPRKNGKTGFVAPLGLFQLNYPPPGARCEVYSVATKEEIAKIVWRDATRLLRTAPQWSALHRVRHKHLTHAPSDSEWRPLGSDSDTLDGLRPELVIMDEIHAWRDRALWDVMNSAFGAAFSPLILQISTEGDDRSGLLAEQTSRAEAVLERVENGSYRGATGDEAHYFGALWTVDKGDPWDSEATWLKANPSLGSVKVLDDMRKLAVGARLSTAARRDFLIKQLNVRQETGPQRWLDIEHWDACGPSTGSGQSPSAEELWSRLRGRRVWLGLDLASTTDTSAVCAIAEDPDRPEGVLAAWHFWLPDEDLPGRIARDLVPYDLWAREGWLSLTPGRVVDVNAIEVEIVERLIRGHGLDVAAFAYDPGWAQGAGQRLQDEQALPMVQCPQRYSTMTPALVAIERTVIAHLLDHGGNPVAHAHARAATVSRGKVGGLLLAKGHSGGRIDGLAALAMAEAAKQNAPAQVGIGAVWL